MLSRQKAVKMVAHISQPPRICPFSVQKHIGLLLCATVAAVGFGSSVNAAAKFKSFDGPKTSYTHPEAINAGGDVVGEFDIDRGGQRGGHAFLKIWGKKAFDLHVGNDNAGAHGINDGGSIVGDLSNGDGTTKGFVRTPDGVVTIFNVTKKSDGTSVVGINADGTAVGNYIHNRFGRPFIRASNGKITKYMAPGDVLSTSACCINDEGTIAGGYLDNSDMNHFYLRTRKGEFTTFDLPGMTADITAINSNGDTVGEYTDDTDQIHGYIRTLDGTITTFDVPGDQFGTLPFGINDYGSISGYYSDSTGASHGFVRTSDGTITTFDPPGSTNTLAFGINERGEIIGEYYAGDAEHAFIRIP